MGCISSKQENETTNATTGAPSGGGPKGAADDAGGGGNIQVDNRLPFGNYRDVFSLKNYWKSVRRKESAGKDMFWKFLKDNPEHHQKYPKLSKLNIQNESVLENSDFEHMAEKYFRTFDNVMSDIEANPGNIDGAINELTQIGKVHKKISGFSSGSFQALEQPFLKTVQDILQDRYNEKCETLFQKFFQFCLKYIVQGYNE